MVWIVKSNNSADGEVGIEITEEREGAYKLACCYIQDSIMNEWGVEEEDRNAAREINERVYTDKFRQAVGLYNDHQSNRGGGIWYEIYEQQVLDKLSISNPTVHDDDFFTDEDEEEAVVNTLDSTPSFVPVLGGGAQCRMCGTDNEYATADKADGTYHCQQCKLFQDMFGTSS